jgi:hypothetical protein
MKRLKVYLILAFLFLTGSAHTQNVNRSDQRFTEEKLHLLEQNLAVVLGNPTPGVQASAAQTVRDLKNMATEYSFSRLVIPLMRIVKNERAEIGPRILAALALHDLHSEMGDYAIKRVAKFSDIQRMKNLCMWLTFEQLIAEKKELDGRTVASRVTK